MTSPASPVSSTPHALARDLLAFIDASPSPWHAVATAVARLRAAGYIALHESEPWPVRAGGNYYLVRGGSLLAVSLGTAPLAEAGWRLLGAHTDSPGLRLKPQAAHVADGMVRLGVEVYGGPILATFTDRDLALAGRVVLRTGKGQETRLLRIDRPLVRLPNLAIHMNREVNEQGLKLHKQNELPLLLAMAGPQENAGERLRGLLGETLGVAAADILTWELAAYDTQSGSLWGGDEEFIASRQLDNLASCHAALTALLGTPAAAASRVVALFDHEEVGSESSAGAAGNLLGETLARFATALGVDSEGQRRAMARSFFVSADMAHAWHPNFPAAYEPHHRVLMNAGPVIKCNANQRYSTTAETAARFLAACERAGVPCQQYAHRTDLGCGSTIGPILAARLGVASVDVGNPMWAMHSARESAGVADHAAMIRALAAVLAE